MNISRSMLDEARSYWLSTVNRTIEEVALPTDSNKMMKSEYRELKYPIDSELQASIKKLCKNNPYSIYAFFVSVCSTLLHVYMGQNAIVVGAPVSTPEENADLTGFNEFIILNTKVRKDMTFKEVLMGASEAIKLGYTYQYFPMNELMKLLHIREDKNLSRFMVAADLVHKTQGEKLCSNEAYDLGVHYAISNDPWTITLRYNNSLFKQESITAFYQHHLNLMSIVLKDINIRVKDIDLRTKRDERITQMQNIGSGKSIVRLLEEQFLLNPDRTAIWDGEQSITYRQLWYLTNKQAMKIREMGVGPNDAVAVIASHSIGTVVSLFAILKVGAVYFPVDQKLPVQRIMYMLDDSRPSLVILAKPNAEITKGYLTLDLSAVTGIEGGLTHFDYIENMKAAYLIYTSGSSGAPKGVIVPQEGLVNLQRFFIERLNITPNDRIGQFASISFDASMWEITMALLCGGELHLLSDDTIEDFEEFTSYANRERITVFTLPPTFVSHLKSDAFTSLRMLITAGSSTSLPIVREWSEKYDYVNAYGPTETSVCATAWVIPKGQFTQERVSIGYPVGEYNVTIVGEDGNERPDNMPGEICISGPGVAGGYLNMPELTNGKFVGLDKLGGLRCYRTGDMGKRLNDGSIVFMGRMDSQVKLRGYRIELDEIKHRLLDIQGVEDAVVTLKDDHNGEAHICAYLKHGKNSPTSTDIIEALRRILPDYMIPEWFLEIPKVPLNNNGKVDYNKLENPYLRVSASCVQFKNTTEKELSELWKEILNVDAVTTADNFMLLGGQSLKSIQLRNRINEHFLVQIPVSEIYTYPVLQDMADRIMYVKRQLDSEGKDSGSTNGQMNRYPLTSEQNAVFMASLLDNHTARFNMPFSLRVYGELNVYRLRNAIYTILQQQMCFKTAFTSIDGISYQFPTDTIQFDLKFENLTNADGVDYSVLTEQFIQPFELDSPPLFRGCVYTINEREYLLLFDIHHLISDEFSLTLFLRTLSDLYNESNPPAMSASYYEYLSRYTELQKKTQSEEYWLNKLNGYGDAICIQYDQWGDPGIYLGETQSMPIPIEINKEAEEIMQAEKISPFVFYLSCYAYLLYAYENRTDLVIGTAVSGRLDSESEAIMGLFANEIALRLQVKPDENLSAFVQSVKETVVEALDHQVYPFSSLSQKLMRNEKRNPLFLTTFSMQDDLLEYLRLPGLVIGKQKTIENGISKPFSLIIQRSGASYSATIKYNKNLYQKETIEQILQDYIQIVKQITINRNLRADNIICTGRRKKEENRLTGGIMLNF